MKEFKGTPSPWSYSPQDGTPGHCYMAQVWDSAGKNLAEIEPTSNQEEATANAKLIASAPELLEALQELNTKCENTKIDGSETYYKAIRAINKALD
jgi:hypothetical protein